MLHIQQQPTCRALGAATAAEHAQAGEVQLLHQGVVDQHGHHGGGNVGGAHTLPLCDRQPGDKQIDTAAMTCALRPKRLAQQQLSKPRQQLLAASRAAQQHAH